MYDLQCPADVRGDDRRRAPAARRWRRRYMHARGGEGVVRERRENATVLLRGQLPTHSFIVGVGMVT
jgi:hypothetical protein